MKQSKTLAKVTALVLTAVMLVTMLPMAVFADWDNVTYDGTTFGTDGYYNVISKKDYVLVPDAATETEMVLNNAAGNRRQVLHIIEVDPSNPDVSIVPGYNGIDGLANGGASYQTSKVTDMAAYYESNLGYTVVGGMNTDLSYSSNAPRILVYNGQIIAQGDLDGGKASATQSYLGVYKDVNGNVSCKVGPISQFNTDKLSGLREKQDSSMQSAFPSEWWSQTASLCQRQSAVLMPHPVRWSASRKTARSSSS